MAGEWLRLCGALGLIVGATQGCNNASGSQPKEAPAATADLSDTDADTSGLKGSETYDQYDELRDALDGAAGTYDDYGCTQDCSGHDAGYQWAEDHDITDESECGGKSWSFQEGCVAYAEDQAADSEDDSEDE